MAYELGQQYEMRVIDIRKDSAGYDYIALQDDDPSKEYRVYNILKCQHESLPTTLYVKVKSIDQFGRIKFQQDEGRLNREHYKVGKLYAFEVIDVKEDFNTNTPYYVIEDDFNEHRYFFKGDQKYNTGDRCILEVEGFTDKGFLKLKEVEHVSPSQVETIDLTTKDNKTQTSNASWAQLPVLNVGDESQTLEFKTSIAFPPGNGEANIDKQLYNILRVITAFMNTDGGTLYVGVHDTTKKVTGIESDYAYLNEGDKDDFNGSYNENNDGYQLKIRNTIDRLCPSLANSLTTIEFEEMSGKTYCKITVKPARRPIFLCGSQLFIRQGNRLKQLKGDEITLFITERMDVAIKDMIDIDGLGSKASIDADTLRKVLREVINERSAIPRDLPKPKSLGEIDYWIIWYDDGTWKRSRDKSDENNVHIQVPVYKSLSDPILAFCYNTGRVNTVKLTTFRKGANLNKLQTKNGWSRTGDKPLSIFLMHATDYLVGYSVDSNGIEYVKLHAISDYTTTASAANQGSPFLPESGGRIEAFGVIGAEHKKNVAHLIITKAKRSVEMGTPLTSPTLKEEIDYLQKVLNSN